jgi:hypothetical protein
MNQEQKKKNKCKEIYFYQKERCKKFECTVGWLCGIFLQVFIPFMVIGGIFYGLYLLPLINASKVSAEEDDKEKIGQTWINVGTNYLIWTGIFSCLFLTVAFSGDSFKMCCLALLKNEIMCTQILVCLGAYVLIILAASGKACSACLGIGIGVAILYTFGGYCIFKYREYIVNHLCPHKTGGRKNIGATEKKNTIDIVVGPSNGKNSKVVKLPHINMKVSDVPVNPQQSGWKDKFKVSVSGTELTVTRIDSDGGWGQNLLLRGTKEPESKPFSNGIDIVVGPSNGKNSKVVKLPHINMKVSDVPVNPQQSGWKDKFKVSVSGTELTVTRIDSDGGWGQNLIMRAEEGGIELSSNSGNAKVAEENYTFEKSGPPAAAGGTDGKGVDIV